MHIYKLIEKKRDGFCLAEDEINFVIEQYTAGNIPDYQISALLMAIYFNGLSDEETGWLTRAMLYSGEVIDLSDLPGIKVDKHSTGGVGDKVSIILAPIVAAAGVLVPMISGRGLGHTGGTLDKLQSIPGFKVDYDVKTFKEKISRVGACLIGQTDTLVPADKKLYALRDVTATVPSIPLIVASIMSKKMAEGINGLVLDVKTGNGAFIADRKKSEQLAEYLLMTGKQFDKPTIAFMTRMDEPLGHHVGNWLEIDECIRALQTGEPSDLMDVTHHLSGAMIYIGKKASSLEDGIERSKQMISSGKAMQKFREIVREQNGDLSFIDKPQSYPTARYKHTVLAPEEGYIRAIDALTVGQTSVILGAGRQKSEDAIDPKAGIIVHVKTGETVQKEQPLFTILTNRENIVKEAERNLLDAVSFTELEQVAEPLIIKQMDNGII
ncbi:MAG: thymidine phosphorylase [Caldithrix sp.]|nr:thymidine phosphorylase [Caldithrix sp.]